MKRYIWLLVVISALAGLGAGLVVNLWLRAPAPIADAEPGPRSAPGPQTAEGTGEARPAFTLATPDGDERSIAAFDGQVVLLNFWATWCGPCLEEVPALVASQRALGERGLQVVGVALDDPEPVREFAHEHDINYPVMAGARDAFDIAAQYGNTSGVLPYTVVIDRDGVIRETHLGALTREQIEALVEPFL